MARADSRGPELHGHRPSAPAAASLPGPRLNHPRSLYRAAYRLYVPASCYSSDAPEEFLFVCFQAAKWDIRVIF